MTNGGFSILPSTAFLTVIYLPIHATPEFIPALYRLFYPLCLPRPPPPSSTLKLSRHPHRREHLLQHLLHPDALQHPPHRRPLTPPLQTPLPLHPPIPIHTRTHIHTQTRTDNPHPMPINLPHRHPHQRRRDVIQAVQRRQRGAEPGEVLRGGGGDAPGGDGAVGAQEGDQVGLVAGYSDGGVGGAGEEGEVGYFGLG